MTAYKYLSYLFIVYIENLQVNIFIELVKYCIYSCFFIKTVFVSIFWKQNSMYLFSLTKHRIEYSINLQDEKFLSMKIDRCGFFFETQSFKTPRKIYRVDFDQFVFRTPFMNTHSDIQPILCKESKIPNIDLNRLKVTRSSFQSFDKVNVPLTLIEKNDSGYDHNKPCLVFAYGGYGSSMLPLFKIFFLLFIELFNGVVGLYNVFEYFDSKPAASERLTIEHVPRYM